MLNAFDSYHVCGDEYRAVAIGCYQKNLLLSFMQQSYSMMLMTTYILNVRIALTPKAISVCSFHRPFFHICHYFLPFFAHFPPQCIEIAMQFEWHSFVMRRQKRKWTHKKKKRNKTKFQNKWNGVAHISLFHLFTSNTHTIFLANRIQFVIFPTYKFSILTWEPKRANRFIYIRK